MSYDQLCQKIGSAIFKIGSNVTAMQKLVVQLGTPSETPNVKKQLDTKRSEVQKSIETTGEMFRQATDLCKEGSPQEQKSRKIQVERLKQQFSEALQKFKKYQLLEADKERAAVSRMRSRTTSLRNEISNRPSVDTAYADNDSLMDDDSRQQNLAQLQEFTDDLETTTALINEREEAIRKLETDMVTVNEIFREIGTMVYEQGDMIDNIEHNVEVARDRIDDGVVQLEKASEYQSKYRKKVFFFLLILVVFGIVLGIIIWATTRKKN
ncbi:hypothetical protein ACHWQZ_G017414 [Mnemiopsis leidyi]